MGTIKSSREMDIIFRRAKRTTHLRITVLAARTPEGRGHCGRVAFAAGKRLGGAVTRNRCRRVLRETARRAGAPWNGWDVVLVAGPGTPVACSAELDRALSCALGRLGVL